MTARLSLEIHIGRGLDGILFGATQEDIEDLLGPPGERARELDSPSHRYDSWSYEWGLSLFFNYEDDLRLVSLQVCHPGARLLGFHPIGMTPDELRASLRATGASLGEEETDHSLAAAEFPTKFLVSYPDKSLNFWFLEGHLEAVQWGYLFSEDGSTVLWPQP